jgi:hypothetical protein
MISRHLHTPLAQPINSCNRCSLSFRTLHFAFTHHQFALLPFYPHTTTHARSLWHIIITIIIIITPIDLLHYAKPHRVDHNSYDQSTYPLPYYYQSRIPNSKTIYQPNGHATTPPHHTHFENAMSAQHSSLTFRLSKEDDRHVNSPPFEDKNKGGKSLNDKQVGYWFPGYSAAFFYLIWVAQSSVFDNHSIIKLFNLLSIICSFVLFNVKNIVY